MKRSVVRRLGAAVVGAAILAMTAVACGQPTAPRIAWGFAGLTYSAPGPGLLVGRNAGFTYTTSAVPAADEILLQKASLSGATIKWATVNPVDTAKLGSGTIIRPPFGRNAYRLAVVDGKGRLVTSAAQTLDVYKFFTFSQITSRPEQTLTLPDNGGPFKYVFQADITLENTSCRSLNAINIYNKGVSARIFRITDTLAGKAKIQDFAITPVTDASYETLFMFTGRSVTPGEDLELHFQGTNSDLSTVYADGSAACLTDTGDF